MKTLQAIATSPKESPEGGAEYVMAFCSGDMPAPLRDAVLGFSHGPDAGGQAVVSTKTVEADGARWLLLNRIMPSGDGHVSHTLAFRDDDLLQGQIGPLLEEMKLDFAERMQESAGDGKMQVEAIVSEFRREVTALNNRVEEYRNAKWWLFSGEEEITRRRREIEQIERTAKASAGDLVKELRGKTSLILATLADGKAARRDGASADPSCFPELLGKFDKLAEDYRELSRIVGICDIANISHTTVADLTTKNAILTEQINVARRELEVSKVSDKIMSSKMKENRKGKARAMAWERSRGSWKMAVIILLSLGVAALLAMRSMEGGKLADITAELAESRKQGELQRTDWGKERKALNEKIGKLQSDAKAMEAKIKALDTGN